MRISRKTCSYCGHSYSPDPRTAAFQKACPRDVCRRERRRRKWQNWQKRHPDYRKSESSKNKTNAWAKTYPDYWKRYRAEHETYRENEKRRMANKRRKVRCVAKTTARQRVSVEWLLALKGVTGSCVAKPTSTTRRLDALIAYLLWREGVAKTTDMARDPATAR
ncbi:MAG: hypothetical protein COB53_04765 [Elusimicrobia bacterium]|nr:MAG: hypothetical protein COB53_04765 [Elusimicrobiota bacterium]